MAEIVLGFASSHGPTLSTPADRFGIAAQRDRDEDLIGPDGTLRDFEELAAASGQQAEEWTSVDVIKAGLERCQTALGRLEELVVAARADVLVVIGNDHSDMLFTDACRPALAVLTGDGATANPWDLPPVPPSELEWMGAMWKAHFGTPGEVVPGCAELGTHLVTALTNDEFEVAQFKAQAEGRTIGEAFLYPFHRFAQPAGIPALLPVVFNTFRPEQPNQPTPGRCYQLGKALRRAIESWDSPSRVAVLASGGLSHFLVDEELDGQTIDALKSGDPAALAALPRERLRGGNTEARNWVTAAGVMAGHAFELIDYVPVRRTVAGTGAAMAFAHWVPSDGS